MPKATFATCPGTVPTQTLRQGSSGSMVTSLQQSLNKLHYGLTVTGTFNRQTYAAVVALQTKYLGSKTPYGSIIKTGVVGPAMWCLILNLVKKAAPPSYVAPTIPRPTLPVLTVGQPFAYTLKVSGGRSPFQWFVHAGTLPTGLTLSTGGTLSGTPTVLGTSNFTVAVTDAHGHTGTLKLSLVVTHAGAFGQVLGTLEAIPADIAAKIGIPEADLLIGTGAVLAGVFVVPRLLKKKPARRS